MQTDSSRIERTAAAWLARRDAQGWSARDEAQLDAWLAEDVAHRVAWLRLVSAWEQADRLKALGAGVPAGGIPPRGEWILSSHIDGHRHATNVRTPVRGRRRRHVLAIAASFVATIAIAGSLVVWQRAAPPAPPVIYRTGVGQSASVPLADGSTATLSSDTRIAVRLSPAQRDIELIRGEAFFEVKKNPSRPFVVSANGRRVIAVGTRFAVRRNGDAGLRVVVTQGLVRLESATQGDAAATLLPAGSVAQVSGATLEVQRVSLEDARELLSWRDGFVVFHDTPLAEAAAEFNRYNARKLVIADPAIADLRVGGHFRWANDAAFVRLIEQVFPVRAQTETGRIVLTGKPVATNSRKHPLRR